jgi:hypothetical protein
MVTFLLSVINTFFKLKEKAVSNFNACNQYNKFGSQFEEIYFTPILSNKDVVERLNKYKALQKRINDYNEEENVENVNYLTTLLYYSINYFFKNRMKRINKDERFWLLDGKPNNPFYPRNRYYVDVNHYFVKDFNWVEDVDKNNLYNKFRHRPKRKEKKDDEKSFIPTISWGRQNTCDNYSDNNSEINDRYYRNNTGLEMVITDTDKKNDTNIKVRNRTVVENDIENQFVESYNHNDNNYEVDTDDSDYGVGDLFSDPVSAEYVTPLYEEDKTPGQETHHHKIEETADEKNRGFIAYIKSWF